MPRSYNNDDDQLDSLLESLNNDHGLDRRMAEFEQAHLSDEERKQNRSYTLSTDDLKKDEPDVGNDTIVYGSAPAADDDEDEGEGTMVFAPGAIRDEEENTSNNTVVIDNDEIQNLIEEEKGPSLKRQKVARPKKSKGKTDWKIAGIVMAVIGGAALCGLLVFGIYQGISGIFEAQTHQTVSKEDLDKIMDWANSLGAEVDKDQLKSMESIYNKLTSAQKDSLNDILRDRTGKSFDELLAEATSGEKEDKDNNNTQIAEKKAKLKDQIADLKDQLADAQQELDAAQKRINDANSQLAAAQQQLQDARNAVVDNSAEISSLNAQLNANLDLMDNDDVTEAEKEQLKAENSQLRAQIDQLRAANDPNTEAINAAQNAVNQAQGAVSALSGTADGPKQKVDSLNAQIADLQSQLDSLG